MKEKKKTVAIITIFDNLNNGTYLQAYALSLIIEKLGYQVIFVDYCRIFNSLKYRLTNTVGNPLKAIYRALMYEKRKQKLQSIIRKNFHTTRSYIGYENLKKNLPKADIYLTGSDQVWNTMHNRGIDKAFYWGCIDSNKHTLISYAASIGLEDFANKDKAEIYSLLKRYSAISVREENAIKILKNMGLNASMVLDPTLLLNKNEWINNIIKNSHKNYQPYILIYSVETAKQDPLIEIVTKHISQKLGLKVKEMCFYKATRKNYVNEFHENPTPQDFISLMANASYIIACSFHGTAFAINFNKPFVSVIPEKYSSRAISLLKELDLQEHFISKVSEINNDNILSINYHPVNAKLNIKRNSSIEFLKASLAGNSKT